MLINEILKEKNITKYKLSQMSNVPYTTLNDICSSKTNILKCNVETVYRLAKALDVSLDSLLENYFDERPAFELFKSNVCHELKEQGDIDFLINVLEKDEIRILYNKKWYPESLYLLAMIDYISRINDIPICKEYNDIRKHKLQTIIYPSSILSLSAVGDEKEIKEEAIKNAIPEFLRFNIIESEVRNVN